MNQDNYRTTKKGSPFVLEGLDSATSYIAFVEAVNDFGVSPMSSIVAFRTPIERNRVNKGRPRKIPR